jgi:hypothetical protein
MLLIIVAIGYDHVSFSQKLKTLLAWILLIGSAFFPLGVLMQTWSHGPAPRFVAALASAMVIIALAAMVLGFLRRQNA